MEASGSTPTPPPTQTPAQQPQYATPQPAVFAGQELAGWGSRLGAYLLDGLAIGVPAYVLGVVVLNSLIVYFVIAIVLTVLYWGLLYSREGERNGQSLGKQALSIRTRRDDGQPMSFGPAVLREAVVKGIPGFVTGLLGALGALLALVLLLDYLWPLWDDENRAVHDMLVKTHVVKA